MQEKNSEQIREIFNHIAPHYDQNNDIISLFTHRLIKQNVVNELPELPEKVRILDLCTGTGDIAALLHKKYPSAEIVGADFSEEMLKIARQKHKNLNFIKADCQNLPFENESFDLVTICFGLRNTVDYDKTMAEISRILKPAGIFAHLDFGQAKEFADKTFLEIVKFVAELQGDDSYLYLLKSKFEFPPVEKLIELFAKHDLKYKMRKDYLFGMLSAQYCVKN